MSKSIYRCFFIFVVLSVVGCEDPLAKKLSEVQVNQSSKRETGTSIREAFRYLPQLIRLDRTAALREIQSELNTWSKTAPANDAWQPTELIDTISGSLRTIDFANRMTELKFGEPECEYLLQSQMLRDVSRWVLERPYHDKLFQAWLDRKKTSMPEPEWLKLEMSMKLFDWTVCNIGIEGQAGDIEKLTTNSEMPINDLAPIYRQLPWQTLTFARGDVWQRARVFTQLAFVRGVDTVVLALPSESGATENAAIRLWCIGVPVGKELYLFEPRWGLPIPSQADDGVATLREAKENPAVLRRAKLPGLFDYPVEQKDLNGLVAVIDVEPFAVGKTMSTLEKSLTGENRLRISINADALEQTIHAIDPKLQVRLWNVPWIAHVYNQSVRARLNEQSPFSINYIGMTGAYITDTPISRARGLHLAGKFKSTVEANGALRSYMDVRVDEQTLKELEFDRDVQMMLGVVRKPEVPIEAFMFQVEQARSFFRRSKFDVAAFLAMINFDSDEADTAIDWLSKRLLAVQGSERWHAHAHYLLGRCYEMKGDLAAAIEEYKFESSPQAAGNRIRIRKLNSMIEGSQDKKPN
jgi:hypothetical protein